MWESIQSGAGKGAMKSKDIKAEWQIMFGQREFQLSKLRISHTLTVGRHNLRADDTKSSEEKEER